MSPESRIQFYRHSPLSGVGIERMGPPPPAGSDQNLLRRKIEASNYAKTCETCVLKAWKGIVVPGPLQLQLQQTVFMMQQQLAPLRENCFSLIDEVEPTYQEIGDRHPNIPFDGTEQIGPKNPVLGNLLANIDRLYGINLTKEYLQLPNDWDGKITPRVRYLIEAALILAKETCWPIHLPGAIDPNVIITDSNGKIVTQIDALLISPVSDIYDYLELRVPFRVRYTTGKGRFTRPLNRHIAQFQDRLARLALWWHKEKQTCASGPSFQFPQAFRLYYLRGTLPRVGHRIPLCFPFFQRWIDNLIKKQDGGYFRAEEMDDADLLIKILEKEAELRADQEAERRRPAFESLKDLREASPTQLDFL